MGSKHDVLTHEEMQAFKVNPLFTDTLDRYITQYQLNCEDCRILDWGCGRGRLVAALLEQNYDAYGIDIDRLPLNNGRSYFLNRGYKPENRLILWQPQTEVPLSDCSFDAIFSDQVLEHVADLETVAREITRLLKPGGVSIHIWPAHRRIIEPHLFMPFVHWLPKNRLRKIYLQILIWLGIEPRWPELNSKTVAQKTFTYSEYSVMNTYYRHPKAIESVFLRHGLQARTFGIGSFRNLLLNKVLRRLGLADWSIRTFGTVGMRVEKLKGAQG